MSDKPSYYELLKHPNWQRKRLEVLERAGFACEHCGSTEKTLHVHHTHYRKGAMPWDYPTGTLLSLCDDCHLVAGELMAELNQAMGFAVASVGYMRVIGYCVGVEMLMEPKKTVSLDGRGYEFCAGISDAWGVCPGVVFDLLRDQEFVNGRDLNDLCREQEISQDRKV